MKLAQWHQIYSLIQGSFLVFDMLGVLDVYNTSYNMMFYTLLMIIRACRMIDLVYEIVVLSTNFPIINEVEEEDLVPEASKLAKPSKKGRQSKRYPIKL
jgi:hypothetical protein